MEDAPSHATPHATSHAPADWPLVTIVGLAAAVTLLFAIFPGALDEPLLLACEPLTLITALLGAAVIWIAVVMVRDEERLNARGETLFPGRKRFDQRGVQTRTDRALRAGIRGLVDGEDVTVIMERLQASTHGGDALPDGRARLCYAAALRCLEQAGGLRREAAGWLEAARDEVWKGMYR